MKDQPMTSKWSEDILSDGLITVREVAEKMWDDPAIEGGFVMEEHRKEQHNLSRVPGGAGAWNPNLRVERLFRCWVNSRDHKNGRAADGTDIVKVVAHAYQLAGLPRPLWLPKESLEVVKGGGR